MIHCDRDNLLDMVRMLTIMVTLWSVSGCAEQTKPVQIATSEIELSDTRLHPAVQYDSVNYSLQGRVTNNSVHTLTKLYMKIKLQDCRRDGPCDTVGEDSVSTNLSLPPGQTRSVNELVRFLDFPKPRGQLQWYLSYSTDDHTFMTAERR